MDKREEKLRELKEIRRAIGIVFLAILTFLGNVLSKYLEQPDKAIYVQVMVFIFILLIFLFILLLVLSLAIWRNLKNGDG